MTSRKDREYLRILILIISSSEGGVVKEEKRKQNKTKTCLDEMKSNQGPDPNLTPKLGNERKGKKQLFTISEISVSVQLEM